jgi:hypothetical protein
MRKEMPISRAFSTYSPGSPAREPPSRFPSQNSHREKCPTSRSPFSHLYKSPADEPTPACPNEPPRCPSPEPSFHNSGYPVKEPSLEALHSEPLEREMPHPLSPLHPSLKVPGRLTHPPVSKGASVWRNTHPRTFFHTLSPQHTSPLPGFPARPPWKEVPISKAFFHTSRFP